MVNRRVEDVEFGKRLLLLREMKKLSRAAAVKQLHLGLSALQQYEAGLIPGPINTEKILSFYGCNKAWLLTGEGVPYPERGPEAPPAVQSDFPPDEFVLICQVNGKISAGGGLVPDNSADMKAAFRREWIKRKGGKPDNMSLIKVDGDSMEPTLLTGDLVLIDHTRTAIAPQGGIYAISIDHEIMIKRIQVLHPQVKLRIISDNKQYPPLEIDADKVTINGKVIWFGREMER
jgi:phage repressor protein C with HTH and peptisase S24 domain